STTSTTGAASTTTTTTSSTTSTTQGGSCTPVAVLDPKANVNVTTRNDAGRVSAKMVIDLAGYTNQAVTVSLADGDTPTIASQSVGALPPLGTSGKKWQFKTFADRVQRVALRDLAPNQPGQFRLSAKARHWFTAAAANQSASSTVLTVRIGNLCFAHAATRKND